MKAMVLAAGRGERMRPLTNDTPKPLLKVGERCLLDFQLDALAKAGIYDVVINTAWLADQLKDHVGDGSKYQLNVTFTFENDGALDTGGGIFNALELLGDEPFLVANSDIWTDIDYGSLTVAKDDLAHLVLVDNPPHHPEGDFNLNEGRVSEDSGQRLTFSGVGVYRAQLFADVTPGKFPLLPLLHAAMRDNRVSGEWYRGSWMDIGTPDRLKALQYLLGHDDDGR